MEDPENLGSGMAGAGDNLVKQYPPATHQFLEVPLCFGAAAYAGLGRQDEAAKLTGRLRDEFPEFSAANWNFFPLIRDVDARERVVSLMRVAGKADIGSYR